MALWRGIDADYRARFYATDAVGARGVVAAV
jgi:hypothetical protein